MENNMNARSEMMEQEKGGKRFKIAVAVGIVGALYFGLNTLDSYSNHLNLFYVLASAAMGFFFVGGIPFGWKIVSKVTKYVECFLFLPIIGWLIYYMVKLCAAGCIGGIFFAKECFSRRKKGVKENSMEQEESEVRVNG